MQARRQANKLAPGQPTNKGATDEERIGSRESRAAAAEISTLRDAEPRDDE